MAGSADPFLAQRGEPTRCGIDSVEIVRIERLLRETPAEDLIRYFSTQELADSGDGPGRAAAGGALAAKEACAAFPRELALAEIEPAVFSIERDAYGAPQVVCSARAELVLGRQRLRAIAVSLTHDRVSASAVALALPAQADAPLAGRLIYRLFPLRRRVILENLRRVFGPAVPEAEIARLAQAHYAHLWRLAGEFVRFRWLSEERVGVIRVDNVEALARARTRQGALILTGHFGNFEVATIAGLRHFPHMRGRFHFIRRAIRPRWLDALVNRRFRQGGFGVLGKRGSLDAILERLEAGDLVVFPFDQHASPPDGIAVDFFGQPAGTFKSLAIMALATGAPVVPASSWREADGSHVLRFEEALPLVECDKVNEEIRRNTRAYNAMLEILVLRHPEQWFWVHRRWKLAPAPEGREGPGGPGAIMAATTEDRR
jgi:KDO2-lipid IV(A) lauroyltransferase